MGGGSRWADCRHDRRCAALRWRMGDCSALHARSRIGGPIWRHDCLRLPKHMLERRVRRGLCYGATRGSTARIDFMRSAAMFGMGRSVSLHDISNSLEFGYAKPISGIEVLDTAGAASAERRLAEILRACVDAGASVSYLPPLALNVAAGLLAAHGCRCRCRNADPARCVEQCRAGRSRDAGIRIRRRISRIAPRCRSCSCIRTHVDLVWHVG